MDGKLETRCMQVIFVFISVWGGFGDLGIFGFFFDWNRGKNGGYLKIMGKMTGLSSWKIKAEKDIIITTFLLSSNLSNFKIAVLSPQLKVRLLSP